MNKANVYQYMLYIKNNHLFLLPHLIIMFSKVLVAIKYMVQQCFLWFEGPPIESI